MNVLETEEITTVEGLHGIRAEWDKLLGECPWATPFQSPEWLIPWWKVFGKGSLMTVAMRSCGALRALAPLSVDKGLVRLLGSGISDYLGLLIGPSMGEDGAGALLGYLAARDGWSSCVFQELRPSSALLFMRRPLEGLTATLAPGHVCLSVALPATVESFRNERALTGRCGSKRAWRRMEGRGLELKAAADEADVISFLDNLFRLHTKRWESVGKRGVLHGPEMRSFHEEAALGFHRKNTLRLYRLSFQGNSLAVLYGFVHRGLYYAYLMGFDPDFAGLSPGRLILRKAAEDCVANGVTGMDFLRGAERYKYDWSPVETRNYTLRITKK